MTKDCPLIYQFNTWTLQAHIMGRTCCAHKLFFVFVLTLRTIYAQNMFSPCSELVVFMYWTCNSMNNLLTYCGLVDPRISASDKDLPVKVTLDFSIATIFMDKNSFSSKIVTFLGHFSHDFTSNWFPNNFYALKYNGFFFLILQLLKSWILLNYI